MQETLDVVEPILVNACKPVIQAWRQLSRELSIEQAEVQVGLGFEGEGNVYIAKVRGNANLTVTLTLTPQAAPEEKRGS